MNEFPAFPVELATVSCRYVVPVRSIAELDAVVVSLATVARFPVISTTFADPWAIKVPLDPVAVFEIFTRIFQVLFVAVTLEGVTIVTSARTVPEPQPLTVQAFSTHVSVGVCAAAKVKMPEPL